MPRKPRNITPAPEPAPDAAIDNQRGGGRQIVEDFTAKIPEAYCVCIRKIFSGKYRHCRTVDPEAVGPILEDFLQRNWGGGTYHVSLHDAGGMVLTSRSGIEIENLPENEKPAVDKETIETDTAIVRRAPSTMADIVEMMREEIARNHELMREMIRARSETAGTSITELIAAVSQIKALTPEPVAPANTEEIFLRGLEFARKASGAAGVDDSSFMSIVREVFELAKPMVASALSGAAAAAAPGAPDPAADEGEDIVDIEPALLYLKSKFRQGTSIPVLTEIIVDQTQGNPEYTQLLLHLVRQPVEEFLALDDDFQTEPMKTAATNLHAELKRRLIPANETKVV